MLSVNNKLVSEDLLEENFVCDLTACKGACCVEGDTGAPLEDTELKILDEIYDSIKEFLLPEGQAVLQAKRYMWEEEDKRWKTPLIEENGPCAYINYENNVAVCGIEKAWLAGKTEFRKPVSCHLYPVRISKYKEYDAVNYERWSICKAACKNGNKLKVPVFRFVKDALIRKYGEEFFNVLETYYAHLKVK